MITFPPSDFTDLIISLLIIFAGFGLAVSVWACWCFMQGLARMEQAMCDFEACMRREFAKLQRWDNPENPPDPAQRRYIEELQDSNGEPLRLHLAKLKVTRKERE